MTIQLFRGLKLLYFFITKNCTIYTFSEENIASWKSISNLPRENEEKKIHDETSNSVVHKP